MLLLLVTSLPSWATEKKEPLFVVGSTTVSKLIEASAALYQTNHDTQIISRPTGSGKGVIAIGEGVSDIGLISRYLTENEINNWPLIQQITIGQDAIVFLAHQSNPIVNITSSEVADIYTGKTLYWKDILKSAPGKITPFSKGQGHGTLDSFLVYFGLISNGMTDGNSLVFRRSGLNQLFGTTRIATFKQVNQAVGNVSRTPWALAFESLGAFTVFQERTNAKKVKMIALDGVRPMENGKFNPRYGLVRPLNLLVSASSSEIAKSYVRFLLSKEGQGLLEQFNYVPMSEAYLNNVVIN